MQPLITLAILVYNQADYIAECFEAAVAQTYPNLQIIISDDQSDDASWKRINELAESYTGPHQVVVNQNKRNLGTLAHFYAIAKLTRGDYLVVNAGDDRSRGDRVQIIADAFRKTGAKVLISDYALFNDSGTVINSHYVPKVLFPEYFKGVQFTPIHGASAAYDMDLIRALTPPERRTLYEDSFFTLGALLLGGRIERIPEPLVFYRQSVTSVSNNPDVALNAPAIVQRERKNGSNAHYILVVLEWFRDEVVRRNLTARVRMRDLGADIAHYRHRSEWLEAGFTARLGSVVKARRLSYLHWALPRLFGPTGLTRLKSARQGVRAFTGHASGRSQA